MQHRHPGARPHARRRTPRPFAAARRTAALLALLVAASASYTVKPGDTLSGIAQEHGVSTAALAEANGIQDRNRIWAGRTLVVPGESARASQSGKPVAVTHQVRRGETLSGIAVRYGVRTSALAQANDIGNRHRIYAGQRLMIPGSGGGSAPAPAPAASGSSGSRGPAGAASRAEIGALIERTARAHGWNPAFIKAVAWQESGWNNDAVSSVGARGIMQIMPGTADFVSRNLAGRSLDMSNPADNVLAGVLFIDYLHGLTGGDRDRILAGYYQGLASVSRNGMYPSTVRYIENVNALRARFSG